jgi:hypothetical protein
MDNMKLAELVLEYSPRDIKMDVGSAVKTFRCS